MWRFLPRTRGSISWAPSNQCKVAQPPSGSAPAIAFISTLVSSPEYYCLGTPYDKVTPTELLNACKQLHGISADNTIVTCEVGRVSSSSNLGVLWGEAVWKEWVSEGNAEAVAPLPFLDLWR